MTTQQAEHSNTSEPSARRLVVRRACIAAALLLCALFLASVARFYQSKVGFSALVIIPSEHESEVPALRNIPHYEYPGANAYDGAFYVQLAMEPLLRDPALDHALDFPAYRARRILFAWTAYALGLGRPTWILQAYALQNVLCWLLLAWLMTRWLPPRTPTLLALWGATLFSHGLISSVRMALLDGPSMLLLAAAMAAAEGGRTWLTSGIVGIAGLGRETNLLGAVGLPRPKGWRGWLKLSGALVLILLPLTIWQDYIWSIYRGTSMSAGVDHLTVPFAAWLNTWLTTWRGVSVRGLFTLQGKTLLILIAITTQAAFILTSRAYKEPWWRLAASYMVLMLLSHALVWEGYPPAITRVALAMKFGFNVLLVKYRPRTFWVWFVLGNLDLVPGVLQLPLPMAPSPV